MAQVITPASRVELRPLAIRPDGDGWVMGDTERGVFIRVPAVARAVTTLLGEGCSLEETTQRLRTGYGRVDVKAFVESLAGIGLISSIDGVDVSAPPPAAPTLPWLSPRHVAWLHSPLVAWSVACIIVTGAVCAIGNPAKVPGYHSLLWTGSGALSLLSNAVLAWSIALLHETAHLATARGIGVPARMNLSTRLTFLAVQTDVTGAWAGTRRQRLTIYLAGMCVNAVIAATGMITICCLPGSSTALLPLRAAVIIATLGLAPQFLVFMRTDIYFVVQDLARTANLYGDAIACLRHHLPVIVLRWLSTTGHPCLRFAARERRAVHMYAAIVVLGTLCWLGLAATVTYPAMFAFVRAALLKLGPDDSSGNNIDGAVVLLVVGTLQTLWARSWWRRHGPRLISWATRRALRGGSRYGHEPQ